MSYAIVCALHVERRVAQKTCTEAYCVHKHTCTNIIHNCKLEIWAYCVQTQMHIACTHRRIAYCVHALITQEDAYCAKALMHTVQRHMQIVHNLWCILYKRCAAYCANAQMHIVQTLWFKLCKRCDAYCANAVMHIVQRQMHIVRTNSRRTHTDGR